MDSARLYSVLYPVYYLDIDYIACLEGEVVEVRMKKI